MRSYKSVGDLSHHLYTKVTVPLKCLTILGNWQCCKTVLLKDQPNPNTASLSLSSPLKVGTGREVRGNGKQERH